MLIETTMRYDPERDVVWVWPDPGSHSPGPRTTTIDEVMEEDELAEDELIDACRDVEDVFADVAARKRERDEIDDDGHVVITSVDI